VSRSRSSCGEDITSLGRGRAALAEGPEPSLELDPISRGKIAAEARIKEGRVVKDAIEVRPEPRGLGHLAERPGDAQRDGHIAPRILPDLIKSEVDEALERDRAPDEEELARRGMARMLSRGAPRRK
jgi:hypothetical protein